MIDPDKIPQLCRERAATYGVLRANSMTAIVLDSAASRIESLQASLKWYADQMCEGPCQGFDPKACAAIGADNCAGCPAVVAISS